jgi:cation diffusion facilitator CzcD-associated flavoprotein CzcO
VLLQAGTVQLLEGEEVTGADWDEGSGAWELYLSSSGESLTSRHVWLATGAPLLVYWIGQ